MIEHLMIMGAWFIGVVAAATVIIWLLIKLASVGERCRLLAGIIAFIIFANVAMYAFS
ncbi:hypothetical protein QNM34_07985 [Rahnella bonaserana]|uniref:hypothetical protein n=1 Tax=Rahnella bonaserana TaxID=2816248 RepID=UPI0024C23A57|nr:hypothetical protein [Rahnella bonaserana]WHZ42206.1 hypothetical protein QNM34_07985 [Rahnella bonaserana]